MAGKGDRYRPVDGERFREGWDRAFGEEVVPTDELVRDAREQADAVVERIRAVKFPVKRIKSDPKLQKPK